MRGLIARARDEHGFTMVTVMAVMFCVTLLSIAALSAAQGDLKPGAHDKSRKVAYAAAEAGVQNYMFHLAQDLDYWAKCTSVGTPNAVNQRWDGVTPSADPRRWMKLPGSESRYAIELLPANGRIACSVGDPEGTMIDTASGTFKIRSTGQDVTNGVKRSIVITLKRKSVLDYLWFTDKEARAPALYGMDINSDKAFEKAGANRDLVTWARDTCARYYGNDPALGNRSLPAVPGTWFNYDLPTPAYRDFTMRCRDGAFAPGDVIAGPMHTNDEFEVACGTGAAPRLGDSVDDVIESSSLGQIPTTPADPNAGWHSECGVEPHVNFPGRPLVSPAAGTWKAHAAPMTLPLTNRELRRDAAPAYRFKGLTTIVLHGTSMRVTGTREDGTELSGTDVAVPADGVVYVSNKGSCTEYTTANSAAVQEGCGTLTLGGDYAANVTFGAENDILINDDITRTASGSAYLLGLIANNYVRVDHPVTNCKPAGACNYLGRCTDVNPTSPGDVFTIEAAILSVTRSFITDNWFCGGELGMLKVYGAIAQLYRGPVGRENSDPATPSVTWFTGYMRKAYSYDEKLRFRSPPHYLDPVQAQWRIQTFSEQAPAR